MVMSWWRHQFQIREVMEAEITEKRKKGRPRKLWEVCVKKDLEQYGFGKERACDKKKWQEQYRPKIANPASWDNGIKRDVVVVMETVIIILVYIWTRHNTLVEVFSDG